MNEAPRSTAALQQSASSGKYKLIAELGRGGMATVYLCVVQGPAGFNKLQVIKRLRPALAADPEFLNMFLEEARLAARINHPNIIQTNEVGFDGHYYFIAMEYVDGQALESIGRKTADQGGIPLNIHLYIIAEALGGLHHAHELAAFDGTPLNVVHRDVSPHNVMVTYDGHAKVLDFGIAKAADSSSDTRTGIMKGKCAYMAPEQFGGKVVDRRADVFAVGIMLWQGITGKRMWKGLSDAEIFARLSRGQIPTARSVNPEAPEELDNICTKALQVDREDRFATAADFQAAIEQFMSAQQRVTSREVGAWLKTHFAKSRESVRAAIEAEISKAPVPVPSNSTDVPILWQIMPDNRAAEEAVAAAAAAAAATAAAQPQPASSGRLALYAVVGLGALGVAGYAGTHASGTDAKASPVSSVVTPATAATPAKSNLVQLQIHATPGEAHIFVDDTPLDGNPSTASFLRDGASHRVRVEAKGYETKREMLSFDSPKLDVDIALEKEKEKAPTAPIRGTWTPPQRGHGSAAPDGTPQQPTPPPPPTQPTATAPPKVEIDRGIYGK